MSNDNHSDPISMEDKRAAFVTPAPVAELPPPAEKLKPESCPIQRTVGAVLVPQASMQFNPKTRQPEQVTNVVMQFIANETHEWRIARDFDWYCIHCRALR